MIYAKKKETVAYLKKTAIGRFSFYLIHLYSHSETAAIEVKVRIGQLWCPGEDSNLRHPL